jgi:hypothetical protein
MSNSEVGKPITLVISLIVIALPQININAQQATSELQNLLDRLARGETFLREQ